ncbi:hypothetical protein EON81_06040 [bacterium]|nr:MAG: hypothetical protein EON81_06040 [bacterium]
MAIDKAKQIWRVVDGYWFGGGSPTTIGLLRITTGFLALVNQLMVGTDWDAWFSPNGYSPLWLNRLYLGEAPVTRINLIAGIDDPRITIPFYWLITVAALLTMVGLWSRISSVILALGIVSLHHQNATILHGGDTVLRVMALYIALAPSGLACSLDRVLGLMAGRIKPGPVIVSLWSQRLISFNVALLYFTTTWLKWFGTLWKNGTATWYPARLNEFDRFWVPDFLNEMPFVKITTYGTLLTEFLLGTLVFYRPARKYVLTMGVLMHTFIEYSMNIPMFSYLMIASYLSFFDGEEVQAWAKRTGARLAKWRTVVRLPAGARLTPSGVAALDAVDPLDLVSYEEGTTKHFENTTAGAARSFGAWPFVWVVGAWRGFIARGTESVHPQEEAAVVP